MFGSYYQADYYQQPQPYTHSDVGEPVPGWGVNPAVAGPTRVGVGQAKLQMTPAALQRLTSTDQSTSGGQSEGDEPISPWVWPVAIGAVVGVTVFIGYKQGWL